MVSHTFIIGRRKERRVSRKRKLKRQGRNTRKSELVIEGGWYIMHPYHSCVYISFWYVHGVCTFRVRALNKSIINVSYKSAIPISVWPYLIPLQHYIWSDGLFCFISICQFGSFKNPVAIITSLSVLYFRFRRFILLVQMIKVISINSGSNTSS